MEIVSISLYPKIFCFSLLSLQTSAQEFYGEKKIIFYQGKCIIMSKVNSFSFDKLKNHSQFSRLFNLLTSLKILSSWRWCFIYVLIIVLEHFENDLLFVWPSQIIFVAISKMWQEDGDNSWICWLSLFSIRNKIVSLRQRGHHFRNV